MSIWKSDETVANLNLNKMAITLKVQLCNLLVWLICYATTRGTTQPLSSTVRILSNKDHPCSCFEVAEPTHEVTATRPLVLEINLRVNTTQEYDQVFGDGAHKARSHKAHFECVDNFVAGLESVTEGLFHRLNDAINVRTGTMSQRDKRALSVPVALSVASLLATGLVKHFIDVRYNKDILLIS